MAAVSNDIAVTINSFSCNFREKRHGFQRFAGRRRQLGPLIWDRLGLAATGMLGRRRLASSITAMSSVGPKRAGCPAPPRQGVKSRTACAVAIH
jgi:hypothetical protein